MAFTAAVAMSIALPPTILGLLKNPLTAWGSQDRSNYLVVCGLAFWTPIFAAIALWDDRPGLRRAARSYGGSAVFAATAAMALLAFRAVATAAAQRIRLTANPRTFLESAREIILPYPDSYFSPIAWRVVSEGAEGIVAAIVAAWTILALSGKGRRPAPWFDLLGFLLGLGWILWLLWRDVAPVSYSS
ncbi:MAG: hypothetical protein BGO49_18110 [Planctomycetales bacterium 71-10]|nr:MAG: hypothetical protein BGO49_18110 [Planctomycetales bacterium 71-10]